MPIWDSSPSPIVVCGSLVYSLTAVADNIITHVRVRIMVRVRDRVNTRVYG